MTKRTFDLVLMETVGIIILWGGLSMWSRRRLMDGPNSGVLHGTAKVVKGLTS